MSTSKRIISLLLTLVMVLGMLPWDALDVEAAGLGEVIHVSEEPVDLIQTEESTASGDEIAVTRAQWLQLLVTTFDYTIEGDIVPDNYFPDLSADAEYYDDVLIAVYYGLVDVLPNSNLRPDEAATREFAAYTLNSCMGYLPEAEVYSFSESATVTYADDIQVAIERGWFALVDGAFLPEQAITLAEQEAMMADAENYLADMVVDGSQESVYTFKEGVIEITEEVKLDLGTDGLTITIPNQNYSLKEGDKIVVYQGGLAVPYQVVSSSIAGFVTEVLVTDLYFEDAIESMNAQMVTDTDPANFSAAEGTDLIFIEESTGVEYTQQQVIDRMATSSQSIYIPKYTQKTSIGNASLTISVELKKSKVFLDVATKGLKMDVGLWLDSDVEASIKVSCPLEAFDEAGLEIPIGKYEVPGVGGIDISIRIEIGGSVSLVKKYHMKVGAKVTLDAAKLRATPGTIFKVTDKGSSVNAEVSAKACLGVKIGFYGKAMPVRGYVEGELGFQAKVRYTTYSEIEGYCVHFAAFLYAEVAAKMEWGMFGYKDGVSWKKDIIKEENSPIKVSAHYEDGKQTYSCTRKELSGTTTGDPSKIADSGYSTGYNSNYSGSGLSSGGSSTGYGSSGEPVVIYTYSLDSKNNATITGYSGNATSLTIPLKLDGYNVTAIGSNAFKNNTTIRTVIMQDNILTIGDSAFYGCTNLRNLTLSESLTSIGSSAFQNCSSLTTVDIPDQITLIAPNTFQNCSRLTRVTLPDALSMIDDWAFAYCGSLQEIEIPDLCRVIDEAAFAECSSLRSVKLSEGLEVMLAHAFYNCDALTSIEIPKALEETSTSYIYSFAYGYVYGPFYGCDNLKNVSFEEGTTRVATGLFANCPGLESIVIPDTVTLVCPSAFRDCVNLVSVTLPSALTMIDDWAFMGCVSLTEIEIPDLCRVIDEAAFAECSSLRSVKLSEGLEVMLAHAFYNCDALTSIEIPKALEETSTSYIYEFAYGYVYGPFYGCDNLKNVSFEEGTTMVATGLFANCPGLESIVIPDTVTLVCPSAFRDCVNLASVTLPSALTMIDDWAFKGCTALTEIDIPDLCRVIDEAAFADCTSLHTVDLPVSLEILYAHSFYNCDALTSIEIPKALEETSTSYIYEFADGYVYGPFYGCDNLNSATFEKGTTMVVAGLFANCLGLETIEIPDTVNTIGYKAFYNCSSLLEINIPESITTMGTYIFANNSSLTSVTWPSCFMTIPDYTFSGCTSLTTVNLPDNLKNIYKYAFENCDALVTFTMPDSVTILGENVFYDCDALTEIHLSENLAKLNNNTFYDCDALVSITIPYGVTSIGNSCFYDCDALVSVDMANSVTKLGTDVFYHNDLLKDVKLSRNLTAIPSAAFKECAELEEIIIPYFTTKIDANAFNSSPKLKKVVAHEKLATITASAFSYPATTVFHGPAGSAAETWCSENSYTFVENTAAATKVTAAESSVSIPKGKTYMLDFDIDPIDFHEVITAKSSNTAVATVDETGKITAVAPGTTTIKIIVGSVSASCKVTVTQAVTEITLNKSTLTLDVPNTFQLTATVTPADASNQALTWTSSNEAAATVDGNGLITAVGNGTAIITATANDGSGISASCTVTVVDLSKIPVASLTLNETTLSLEAMESYQLTAMLSPSNAANKALIWTSSDEEIVTVDSNGRLTAVKKGTATITATAADGYGASASCQVTVSNNGYLVTSLDQFQSSHPYANNCTDFWLYTQPGANSLTITFTAETDVEDGFDYLYVYDGNGTQIGKYTGAELANQTITIPGNTVKVQIESDDSGNTWGFQIIDAEYTGHEHSYAAVVTVPTCTEQGYTTYTCECGESYVADYVDALDHSFGDWVVIQEPTTEEEGIEEHTCIRCGHSEQQSVAKLEIPFKDVAAGSFYYDPVMWAVENGITNGTSTTTFSPNDQCMRAHVVTFLWRAAGSPEPTRTDNPFVDVKPTDFYYKPVLWALENGITSGMDATHFGPTSYCNRAQVVTFLYRTMGSPELESAENPFTDVVKGSFYENPVLWAVKNGITNGLSATAFGPDTICNRAQIVTFLYRAFVKN